VVVIGVGIRVVDGVVDGGGGGVVDGVMRGVGGGVGLLVEPTSVGCSFLPTDISSYGAAD